MVTVSPECEVFVNRIDSPKSAAIALSWEKGEVCVATELLPQAEFLKVLFTSEGRLRGELGNWQTD